MAQGQLAADRLESYLKLQEELATPGAPAGRKAQIEEKRRGRTGAKALRHHPKSQRGS